MKAVVVLGSSTLLNQPNPGTTDIKEQRRSKKKAVSEWGRHINPVWLKVTGNRQSVNLAFFFPRNFEHTKETKQPD